VRLCLQTFTSRLGKSRPHGKRNSALRASVLIAGTLSPSKNSWRDLIGLSMALLVPMCETVDKWSKC
jgi:hypothetical protein